MGCFRKALLVARIKRRKNNIKTRLLQNSLHSLGDVIPLIHAEFKALFWWTTKLYMGFCNIYRSHVAKHIAAFRFFKRQLQNGHKLPHKIQWYIAASGLRICEDLDMFRHRRFHWVPWIWIFLLHDHQLHQLQPSYSTMATSASTQSIILKVDSTEVLLCQHSTGGVL